MRFHVVMAFLNNRGSCTCGWQGKRRWLPGLATSDAYIHGAESGHMPAGEPLPTDRQTKGNA
ncbi:hypothetical protein [Mycolicibacterium brumae]|uniref:Uncharacterized protein n=1 Tax=Mycolicibacterium brumae TaxID=85968 RepID=A0A2G5PB26_9MYCO|nr:hypothetical protein [Mycolicibacterium brumae]MCV7193243.1 hypothetical protein [Mycolicibacterium brumae]PIB75526.1 hypothetical protein CQY22_008880 [Mycolicibacterium brumae]RWA16679.1 hypothetical protein MBRU_08110 [Mycolicibacterium brumae DSM 44177]UWW09898.1 hypothetical protein L2Z93_003015 [Mycolicibacterium brumae]